MTQTASDVATPTTHAAAAPSPTSPDFVPGYRGLRCRACGAPGPDGAVFVCSRCFGPLEPVYDLEGIRSRLDRATLDAREPTIWRYAELLPVTQLPVAGLKVGHSPLTEAPRLAARLGLDRLWIKDDSRNPTLSFKDRPVAVAAARAASWGYHTLACASTGNLSAAVAAAAAVHGLRAVVFIPADLETAKIAQARALGATVVRVDGPYDDVNRLCLELTDELDGWAVLNVNLRPFYAEGSKTIAYEIAQQLGWRAPDVLVAPLASGSMYTKLARGFDELVEVELLDEAPVRYFGGQADGCAPIAAAFAAGTDRVRPVEKPETIVRSLVDRVAGRRRLRHQAGARERRGHPERARRGDHRRHPPAGRDHGHPHRDGRGRDPGGPATGHRRGSHRTPRGDGAAHHGQWPQDPRCPRRRPFAQPARAHRAALRRVRGVVALDPGSSGCLSCGTRRRQRAHSSRDQVDPASLPEGIGRHATSTKLLRLGARAHGD